MHDLLPKYKTSITMKLTNLPNVVITSYQLADGSIQLGLVMVHLVYRALYNLAINLDPKSNDNFEYFTKINKIEVPSNKIEKPLLIENNQSSSKINLTQMHLQQLKSGNFHFIRQLGRYLPFFVQIKNEVI